MWYNLSSLLWPRVKILQYLDYRYLQWFEKILWIKKVEWRKYIYFSVDPGRSSLLYLWKNEYNLKLNYKKYTNYVREIPSIFFKESSIHWLQICQRSKEWTVVFSTHVHVNQRSQINETASSLESADASFLPARRTGSWPSRRLAVQHFG